MSKPEHRVTGGAAWRSCGLLVLVALAWTQLAFATHQFDHPATSTDYTCSVCLQLDRSDDVVVTCATTVDGPDPAAVGAAGPPTRPAARDGLHARQRGPPRS